MNWLIGILVVLIVSCLIAIPWVNAIDRSLNDPEWQEHKDEPDYWD